MMLVDHKQDLFNVLKEKLKKEKKWFTPLLYMKLMLSTQDLKDFWPYLLEIPEKLNKKSEIKLIKKLPNGGKIYFN
jgi:hypothetical protein